ncbi:mRNA-decapping enzyme 1B [Blomia tropicalis]|nr:mRNA-decapping enzyme 1B [Blomia tropicalis]
MVDLNELSINLRALRKIDDNIREILFTAGQVAIYYFNSDDDTGKWQRKEIEGALFFVRRSVQPEHAFVVINKLSTINLVQKITKDFETNIQPPYLMFKNTEDEIYCIWFYDQNNCTLLNSKIEEIISELKKTPFPSIGQANGSGSGSGQTNSDLLKMMLLNSHKSEQSDSKAGQSVPATATVNQMIKPVPQRRSVNLNDLFESHLNISSNSENHNDVSIHSVKNDQDQLYALKKNEERIGGDITTQNSHTIHHTSERSINSPAVQPLHSTAKQVEGKDFSMKPTLEQLQLIQQQNAKQQKAKIQMNSSMYEFPLKQLKNIQSVEGDSESRQQQAMYLSMEQLKKTMIYLLQNDADFLHSIHTAYVTAIKK